MRRTSPGVLGAQELIDARLLSAELCDPEPATRALEPFVTEARRRRLHEVIDRRLASVAAIFDGPYDPHNGAAVVRSCDAFGVQHLHVIERTDTPFLAARSVARGAQKWVDVICHRAPEPLLARVRDEGRTLVAADPCGELAPEDLASVPRLALVLGNEREGVRESVARACAARVRVPMRGFVESLNVSVTAAILLYAATRGRAGDLDEAARRRLYLRGLVLSVPRAEEILAGVVATARRPT